MSKQLNIPRSVEVAHKVIMSPLYYSQAAAAGLVAATMCGETVRSLRRKVRPDLKDYEVVPSILNRFNETDCGILDTLGYRKAWLV